MKIEPLMSQNNTRAARAAGYTNKHEFGLKSRMKENFDEPESGD